MRRIFPACPSEERGLEPGTKRRQGSGMRWIVFFDGDCALCSRGIRVLAVWDRHDRLRFSPLQGELSRSHGLDHHAGEEAGTMVVLRGRDGAVFLKSDAVLEIARALGPPWSWFAGFRRLPLAWRDALYGWIARNRYRWFGRKDACALPGEAVRRRLV